MEGCWRAHVWSAGARDDRCRCEWAGRAELAILHRSSHGRRREIRDTTSQPWLARRAQVAATCRPYRASRRRGAEHNGVVRKGEITADVVSRLVAAQFPQWADLEVRPVDLDGWDNTTFRLGDEMSVQLPSDDVYIEQIDKEHRWLPVLAPFLPHPIPEPLAKGQAGCGFGRPWSIYRWLDGEPAALTAVRDLERLAGDVAGFVTALQQVPTVDRRLAG